MEIWKRFYNRFFYTEFRQNVLILTTGNAIVQGLAIVSYPILTRLYPDEIFGQYALFNSVLILLSFTITFRYEAAIPLPKNESSGDLLKKSAIALALICTVIITVFTLTLGDTVETSIQIYLPLLPLAILASSLTQVYRYWYLRINQLVKFFKLLIGFRLTYVVLALAFPIIFSYDINGLIVSLFLASVLMMILLLVIHATDFKPNINLAESINLLKEHSKFPKYSLPSSVINHFTNQLPVILIAFYFSDDITGQYAVAHAVLFLPQYMITTRISEALYRSHGNKTGTLRVMVIKIWKSVGLILPLPCAILYFFGVEIFQFLLGPDWQLAGVIAEFFAIQIFFSSFLSAIGSTIDILGLQVYALIGSIIRMLYTSLAFFAAGINSDLLMGIHIVVISAIILNTVMVVIIYRKLPETSIKS